MTDKATLPEADETAREAVARAREIVRTGETDWHKLCLKFVRTCWGLPLKYETAREAWENAHVKHAFTNVKSIPFGAPVFSRRPHAGPDDSGHVFLAGGCNRHGVRVFRSTDIQVLGGVSPCTIDDIQQKWGHEILGWSEDLNGFALDLPAIPRRK